MSASTLTHSCCCPSAGRRARSRCGRSWRTSPAAANIPPERLDDVAEHYLHFGGVSPINGINRALIEQLRPNWPSAGWTCRSTSATATGIPTSRTPSRRCGTTAFGARRCSPRRRGAAIPVARNTSRTSPGPARRPARCARLGQAAALLRPSAVRGDVRRGHPARRARRRYPRTPGWSSPRTRSPSPPTSVCGPQLYSRQVAYAAGWSRRRPATPITTRSGSRDRDRRRCRGWSPTSPTTFRRWPRRDQGRDRLPGRVSSPTTSRWSGISTTSCDDRPTPRASRWPARRRRTPTRDSPAWRST